MIDHVIGPVTWAVHTLISNQSQHRNHDRKDKDIEASTSSKMSPLRQEEPKVKEKNVNSTCTGDNKQQQNNDFSSQHSYQAHVQEREQVKTFLKRARAAYGR